MSSLNHRGRTDHLRLKSLMEALSVPRVNVLNLHLDANKGRVSGEGR